MRFLVLTLLLSAAVPCAAQSVVAVAPGFGTESAKVDRTAPSEPQPTAWASGRNGTEYLSAAPTFVIHVTAKTEIAFRVGSQQGSVVQAYLRSEALNKLWDIPLANEADQNDPNLKHYASGWQNAVLPPGDYVVHFSHYYPGHSTEQAWFTAVDLTPRAVTIMPGFAPSEGELHDLRSQPWNSEGRIAAGNEPTGFSAIAADGPCRGRLRPDSPMVVVALREALGATRIALARGNASAIFVQHSSGFSACSNPEARTENDYLEAFVDVPSLAAGTLSIWVVRPIEVASRPRHSSGDSYFDIEFEDLTRPRAVAWSPATPSWTLDGPVPQALDLRVNAAGRGPARALCPWLSGSQGRTEKDWNAAGGADVLLSVRRPIDGLLLRTATAGSTRLSLEGPFGPDGRSLDGQDVREKCLVAPNAAELPLPRLEPGTYALRVGFGGEDTGTTLVLRDGASIEAPLKLTLAPPDNAPLSRRLIGLYYAMFPDVDDPARIGSLAAESRFGLFLAAPFSLFVYPTFDLDGASAALVPDRAITSTPAVTTAFPRNNEPLLVLALHAASGIAGASAKTLLLLSADGAVWAVGDRYLSGAATGPALVPAAPRDVVIEWDSVRRVMTPEDEPKLEKVHTLMDKEQACMDKMLGGKERLVIITQTGGGSTYRQNEYAPGVVDRAVRACDKGSEKAQKKLLVELEAKYRARVGAALAQIGARFQR